MYQLTPATDTLRKVAPQRAFTAANGVAISADDRILYLSTWEDGIVAIDLQSGAVKSITHPRNICLAFIDGLYATEHSLVAFQNGPMLPRIVEFSLSEDRWRIVGMNVLERRNPAFDGITTGVIAGSELYYVANPQTDKKGHGARPLQVLGLHIAP